MAWRYHHERHCEAGVAGQRRDVFAVDEDAALAALEDAWTEAATTLSVDDGTLVRRSAAPEKY